MSKLINRKLAISLAMFALITVGSATIAKADSAVFNINVGSTLPNQNYGTLSLNLNDDGSITVSISLIDGNRIIQTGQDVAIGFNSSLSPNPTISVTGLPAGYSLISGSPNSCSSPCAADGFGNFEYGIGSTFKANDPTAASNLSFTVFCTSCAEGVFTSVFDLVSNSTNPPGSISSPFAMDIFCPTCNNGNGATGYVGTGTSAVPEPATMLLLGTGLFGVVAGIRRRRRSQK